MSLTKYNYQFDEGPRGPMLSWDYTSETDKMADVAIFLNSSLLLLTVSSSKKMLIYQALNR